jgi:hypothetical protein
MNALGEVSCLARGVGVFRRLKCCAETNGKTSLLMQMLGRHKSEQENWEGYYHRMAAKLRALKERCHIMPLSLQCCLMYFGLAGHVARMSPSSGLSRELAWRNSAWYGYVQGRGCDVYDGVISRMSRVGRPVRWEDNLEEECGAAWQTLCADRFL